jgi:hypothetical protein
MNKSRVSLLVNDVVVRKAQGETWLEGCFRAKNEDMLTPSPTRQASSILPPSPLHVPVFQHANTVQILKLAHIHALFGLRGGESRGKASGMRAAIHDPSINTFAAASSIAFSCLDHHTGHA